MLLIFEGSEFHNLGAAIDNDASPNVAVDVFSRGVNNIALLDRRLYLVFWLGIYKGAISCNDLKLYSVGERQPVELFEHRCNMAIFFIS